MRSLRWRLLLGATAAISVALLVAWFFMTVLFERHLQRRLQADLTRDALAMVAGLSVAADGRPVLSSEPGDTRLRTPAAGYYWQVQSNGQVIRSRSLWDAELPTGELAPASSWRMRYARGPFQQSIALLERSVQLKVGKPAVLVQLAQDMRPLATARDEFGRELAIFLTLLGLVLSAAAWLQVGLGLRPLAKVRAALPALRESASARLPDAYPSEIQPLAEAINSLADARETDLHKARRRAADLAHGLKTPLAAMTTQSRRAREAGAADAADGMDRAIAAMLATVDSELARARVAAMGAGHGQRTRVRDVLERVVSVLEHTDKGGGLAFTIDVPDNLTLPVRDEDLSEILGAVLENATRFARRQVRASAIENANEIALVVEDDGPGIARDRMDEALLRGGRLDEGAGGGDGLGLAIARELVEAMGGRIALESAALGGLMIRFAWPKN